MMKQVLMEVMVEDGLPVMRAQEERSGALVTQDGISPVCVYVVDDRHAGAPRATMPVLDVKIAQQGPRHELDATERCRSAHGHRFVAVDSKAVLDADLVTGTLVEAHHPCVRTRESIVRTGGQHNNMMNLSSKQTAPANSPRWDGSSTDSNGSSRWYMPAFASPLLRRVNFIASTRLPRAAGLSPAQRLR